MKITTIIVIMYLIYQKKTNNLLKKKINIEKETYLKEIEISLKPDDRIITYIKFNVKTPEKQELSSVCSLDPGCSPFYYVVDDKGKCFNVEEKTINKIYSLMIQKDKIKSKMYSKETDHTKKEQLEEKYNKLENRRQSIIYDIHNKFIKFLVTNYSHIIISKFNVHCVVDKKTRNIGKSTSRTILSWCHGLLRKKLKEKAELYGCHVYEGSESWSSKTCCFCGSIKHDLGNSKIYKCINCNSNHHRDFNGAMNIFIRHIKNFTKKIPQYSVLHNKIIYY